MALVELRRAVQGDLRPHRLEARAERGAAQPLVGVLELLDVLGVPPDHHVGVGTQAAQLVDAAHHDVVGGELVEQVGDLGAPRPRDRRASPYGVASRNTDHIV